MSCPGNFPAGQGLSLGHRLLSSLPAALQPGLGQTEPDSFMLTDLPPVLVPALLPAAPFV